MIADNAKDQPRFSQACCLCNTSARLLRERLNSQFEIAASCSSLQIVLLLKAKEDSRENGRDAEPCSSLQSELTLTSWGYLVLYPKKTTKKAETEYQRCL